MGRKTRTTASIVEQLLEKRRLYEEWLAKLDSGGGQAMPPHVVQRVRNDYRARLSEAMTELTKHHDGIRQALAEVRARQSELERQQAARRDELSELRLRKQVGEIEDYRFKEQNAQVKASVDEVSKELGLALRDIERFEEILELIAEGSAAPAPPAPPTPAEVKPEPVAAQKDLDELAFLRSVTGAEAAPRRESRPVAAPAAPPEPPTAEPVPVPAPLKIVREEGPAAPPETGPAAAPAQGARGSKERARELSSRRRSEEPRDPAARPKELICTECGTANLPTEWYCQKCGAELTTF